MEPSARPGVGAMCRGDRQSRDAVKRSPLRRTAMKRTAPKKRPKAGVNGFTKEDWKQAGIDQRVCQVTGRQAGWNGIDQEGQPYQRHHAVLEQTVIRAGGDIYDPRNCLRIATWVHRRHHDGTDWKIHLKHLRDENLEFAVELLGCAAHIHLTRHYSGHDERLEILIAELGAPDAAG